jgi:hypothetical protein
MIYAVSKEKTSSQYNDNFFISNCKFNYIIFYINKIYFNSFILSFYEL